MLQIKNVTRFYKSGLSEVQVLKNINLEVQEAEAICLLGASGSGKSTLLQIMGTLDRPTSGEVTFDSINLFDMNDDELSCFRNEKMGFVFQFHHLVMELTALENVILPCLLVGEDRAEAEAKAQHWFEYLGILDRMTHYPI